MNEDAKPFLINFYKEFVACNSVAVVAEKHGITKAHAYALVDMGKMYSEQEEK